jgi:hypothetical protein
VLALTGRECSEQGRPRGASVVAGGAAVSVLLNKVILAIIVLVDICGV